MQYTFTLINFYCGFAHNYLSKYEISIKIIHWLMYRNSSIEKSSFYIFFSLFFALNGIRGLGLNDSSLAAESSFLLYC